MLYKRSLLSLLLSLTFLTGLAQHRVYEQFSSKDGLPSNTIYDITQDERGFILFATDNGLSQFDGTAFITYSITDGLPDNEILKLFKDSQNRIWLMGFNGEVGYVLNGHFFNSLNTPILAELSFKNNIDEVFEDRSGNIWFYGRNSILRCLTQDSKVLRSEGHVTSIYTKMFIEVEEEPYLLSNFPRNEIQSLKLKETSIEVNTLHNDIELTQFNDIDFMTFRRKGFYFHADSLGMKLYEHHKEKVKGFNAFWPPKIQADVSGHYWAISNFTGLYLMSEGVTGIQSIFTRKDFAASSYFKDSEGNQWISSINNGVLFFPNTKVELVDFKDTNDLQVVFRSEDSNIFIGDYQGNLSTLENKDQPKLLFRNSQTKFSRSVANKLNDIVEYEGHIISIHNSDLRVYERRGGEFTGRFAILSIASGKRGYMVNDTLYVACSNNVYRILPHEFIKKARWSTNKIRNFVQPEDLQPNNSYRKIVWNSRSSAILKDRNNRLWIGNNKGLFFIENDEVVPYTSPSDFQKCNITDIKEMADGTILVATNGYGLGVINKENSYFINTVGEELNPVINSITLDENDGIWLATNTGLSGFILEDKTLRLFERYTPLEGLSSKNIRKLIVNDTIIYAASQKGLNIVNRNKSAGNGAVDVPIYLNKITVNDIPMDSLDIRSLKHYHNDLYITYAGVSFRSGKNLKYDYRLNPWESEWITTNSKEVRYSNLPPDNYRFEVKGVDKDGVESMEPAIFNFSIKNAWYDNLVVRILAILLTALLIWYLISIRIKTIRTQSHYNEKIAVLKHQALLAQMNPHFIHNSLSSIQHFILSHDINQAQSQLSRFATLIRTILANSKKTVITLAEELGLVENYLKLERIRFDNSFKYDIAVDIEELDTIEIPPMILQPIVENAIIHGVSALNGLREGEIHIRIVEKGDFIECGVIDNGIGIKTSMALKDKSVLKHDSLALDNIKERLKLHHHDANVTSIELYDEAKMVKGTEVTVLIPIINRI